jgi:Na+-transporting NADH:ubiquinone oxidoreductase subunit C
MQHSTLYTVLFAAAVCLVCGVLVSSSAVTLKDRQDENSELERQRNVLLAAGLMKSGEKIDREEVGERFRSIEPVVIRLDTGDPASEIDPATFDQRQAANDPATSRVVPPNRAGVARVPLHALVYQVVDEAGTIQQVVIPIQGMGLWSTLYGFLALDSDTVTIRGITFYEHGETPGLGGEVDNPRWKDLWPGRRAFDESWTPRIEVIKGRAGPAQEDPYRVDGISGATITSRGVSDFVRFWLGENGFGPYLASFRNSRSVA